MIYRLENCALQNRVSIIGNAEELARAAEAISGSDGDRIKRIIPSIPDPGICSAS